MATSHRGLPVREAVPLGIVRKAMARGMKTAVTTAALSQVSCELDLSALAEVRRTWPAERAARPSLNTLIMAAVARTLPAHPLLNAELVDETIVTFDCVNLGMAVAVPDGLIVVVIPAADRLPLADLAAACEDRPRRTRTGKLKLADIEGDTFTVSNLGMYGVDAGVPLLRPPESAILLVGAARAWPVVRDGQIVVSDVAWFSLSFDHRFIDGALPPGSPGASAGAARPVRLRGTSANMLSVNAEAMTVVRRILDAPEAFGVEVSRLANGSILVDMGQAASGSWQAGRLFTQITVGGLGEASFESFPLGGRRLPAIRLMVGRPLVACMGCQVAGWRLADEPDAPILAGGPLYPGDAARLSGFQHSGAGARHRDGHAPPGVGRLRPGLHPACGMHWADPAALEQMVARVEAEAGPIEVLVNNAGTVDRSPFLDVSLATLDAVFATNIHSVFYLSQLVARCMAKHGRGAIIHVSSILAQQTIPNRTAYAASKGAVESLTRAIALDLAPYGIRVNAVAPGLIRTERAIPRLWFLASLMLSFSGHDHRRSPLFRGDGSVHAAVATRSAA
ncbi:MAG: methenyltetrahydromethanopterin cyclohydrolase [Anaerolineae bacterium]